MKEEVRMEELCNNCEYRKKRKFTTLFECKKYGQILVGNPPVKCKQCLEEKEKPKKTKKKEYIEVR